MNEKSINEMAKAYQDLYDHLGEVNASAPNWKIPECDRCSFCECCEGLDNLRTTIVKDGVIIGYKPGCKYYSPVKPEKRYKCEFCGKMTDDLYIGRGHPYLCPQCYDDLYYDLEEDI